MHNTELNKTKELLPVILAYPDCFEWRDLCGHGTPCFHPDDHLVDDAPYISACLICIPKCSADHIKLAGAISKQIGKRWVSYMWLIRAVASLCNSNHSPDSLRTMCEVSRKHRIANGLL